VWTVTKRTYGLDPVPAFAVINRDAQALPPAGYVALRTFIGPADALLAEAFAQLELAGVQDVVVDLRYNGGGLISVAENLANLLGGGLSGSVMYDLKNNELHRDRDVRVFFAQAAGAVSLSRIAFITTGASASASELVPNVLEAYKHADVALVGAKTYGKPVGQRPFELQGCDTIVYVVSIRLVNGEGDGSYYGGLPDVPVSGLPAFSGPLCDADDDLTHEQSDPAEASTAAALEWLATGICPAPVVAKAMGPASASKAGPAPDLYPEAPAPDVAQRHVRGLF
jgi:C-terminal processing protease CtpA/Prc